MPKYDIECVKCFKQSEIWCKYEDPIPRCDCKGERKRVILTGPAFKTDFAIGSTKSAAEYLGDNISSARAVLDLPDGKFSK